MMTSEMWQHLERYDAWGLCVIPLRPRDKRPPERFAWGAYQMRRSARPEWEAWWSGEEPNNIGILTGHISSDLAVLDCDDEESYRHAISTFPLLAESATVRSGRGFHVYLRLREAPTILWEYNGARNHLKGAGGYVVAPPSIHPSGRRYEWVNPDADIEGMPRSMLLEWVESLAPKQAERTPGEQVPWVTTLLADGAPSGERDVAATRLAGYLLSHHPDDVVESLMLAWGPSCEGWGVDFGPRDIRRIVSSVSRYHRSRCQGPQRREGRG